MGDAIGQVLALAVGVALSPLPIIAVVLMLGTPRARVNGPAFVAGWVLGLAVVGTLVLVVAGRAGATSGGGPAHWVGILEIVLGVALLGLAVRQWRGRPKESETAALPKWMQSLDRFTPTRSLAIGVALAAINPKNLLLTVAAAAAIAQTGASTGSEAAALAVFVLIATLGVGAPVALYFVLGERAARMLESLTVWMAANNATIMTVLLLLIGAKLIGDGISVLS